MKAISSYEYAVDALSSPKLVVIIFTLFLVGYIVFIDKAGGFSNNFLHFGPGTTPENTPKFLGITMDSWNKVYALYVVSFFAALMTSYYNTVMSNHIHSYIWNRALPKVPFSRAWTYVIVMMEPFFYQMLGIIQFFTMMTMQLQFILPEFVGSLIAEIPFTLQRLSEKTFAEA